MSSGGQRFPGNNFTNLNGGLAKLRNIKKSREKTNAMVLKSQENIKKRTQNALKEKYNGKNRNSMTNAERNAMLREMYNIGY